MSVFKSGSFHVTVPSVKDKWRRPNGKKSSNYGSWRRLSDVRKRSNNEQRRRRDDKRKRRRGVR